MDLLIEYIEKIKKKKIRSIYDVPEELRNNLEIINMERAMGLRESLIKGFDVLKKQFFVEELVKKTAYKEEKQTTVFNDFERYYEFLNGDIYENAYYFGYKFSLEEKEKYNLVIEELKGLPVFEYTIQNFLIEKIKEQQEKYDKIEKTLILRKRWIKRFNESKTYTELLEVINKQKKSKDETPLSFYLWNYVNCHGKKSHKVIMKIVSDFDYISGFTKEDTCFIYGVETAIKGYDCKKSEIHRKKENKKFQAFADGLKNKEIFEEQYKYFDKNTHFYCVSTNKYTVEGNFRKHLGKLCIYFEKFEEFAEYVGKDLTDLDLSNDLKLDLDEKEYKINNNTKLPVKSLENLETKVEKIYNRNKNVFEIKVTVYDLNSNALFSQEFNYKYFFEFYSSLDGDLSGADLIFCDGLLNLVNVEGIDLSRSRVVSSVREAMVLPITKNSILYRDLTISKEVVSNEDSTSLVLCDERKDIVENESIIDDRKIYYITDVHLMHRFNNANCMTDEDCTYKTQQIIDELLKSIEYADILLIGGDLSYEFSVYREFIERLHQSIKERMLNLKVFFVLGNHELWGFKNETIDEIVSRYRELIKGKKMYLLQNEIALVNDDKVRILGLEEINAAECKELRAKLMGASAIILGGIGFSKYNQKFNALSGIYRNIVSREMEINESEKIEKLHNKLCCAVPDKSVIVLTHMPLSDWCQMAEQEGFIYVSGHNHRNEFYDDGAVRRYADNQIGYKGNLVKAKYFYYSYGYDWFVDYKDGVYEISRNDYIDFCRGKNINMTFNREIDTLYMLKKGEYYCFIHKTKSGSMTILNGGSRKSIKNIDIEYYYDNMMDMINAIKTPFDRYFAVQAEISRFVKQIGGEGRIHGAIIDIDYLNHIYLNPYDLTITPYFAYDIFNKYVYPNIKSLLKARCPELHSEYCKLLESGSKVALTLGNENEEAMPKRYFSTDIYAASREIKKMQKMKLNILSVWYENPTEYKKITD